MVQYYSDIMLSKEFFTAMINRTVVTRFAPSPTGYMHIGNLRTALYSYLIAKHSDGTFILRIEDTDRERLVEGATDVIIDTLKVTGLRYDEGPGVGGENGPYIQSERKEIYLRYAKELVERGAAYYCFCSKERLESLHEEDGVGGYDRHCRDLPKEEVEANLKAGLPYVIRQKIPLEGTTSYEDAVFGTISTENKELQDQILMKADGYPTYNFCHVVDDHLMGVTHVVRGSEYLTSTPKYALLYDAFGWQRPIYVHLPLLMGRGEDGTVSKLSKRHGAVSFADLTADGYLPEAIVNYIALLGWCPKNTENEFFTLEELTKAFSLDGINKSPSVFDYEKLLWFNGEYIRKLTPEEFKARALPFIHNPPADKLDRILPLVQPRIGKLSEIDGKIAFFSKLPDYDPAELFQNKKNKITPDVARDMLPGIADALSSVSDWNNDALYATLTEYAEKSGLKSGAVLFVARAAVSGLSVTPGGATEIMEILGKDETLARLECAEKRLG